MPTAQQLLDWAKRAQFQKPELKAYEAVYDIQETPENTQENKAQDTPLSLPEISKKRKKSKKKVRIEKERILGGTVKVRLLRRSDHWRYEEDGTYRLKQKKGGMLPCKWHYAFDEDLDSCWFNFSYQWWAGDALKVHHTGKALFEPLQKTFTLFWKKPAEDTVVLGRRVFFPLSFRKHVYKLLHQDQNRSPKLVETYVFTGHEKDILPATECVISAPKLLYYNMQKRGNASKPLLGWPMCWGGYKEKRSGEKLMPFWQGEAVWGEDGVLLSYQQYIAGTLLQCDYRPGSIRFLEGNK